MTWLSRRSPVIVVRLLTVALCGLGVAATCAQIIFDFPLNSVGGLLFGSYDIYWRGILAALAVVWGAGVAIVHQKALEPQWDFWPLLAIAPGVLLGGVIGGRIAALLWPQPSLAAVGIAQFSDVFNQLPVALNFRQGGLALAGILLGGGVVLAVWGQLRSGIIHGVAAGQLILIWANLWEQSYFGPPTSIFLGLPITMANRPSEWIAFDRFHPLFLYEAIGLAAVFIALPHLKGAADSIWLTLAAYLALYGPLRGILTLFNPNTFLLSWGDFQPPAWSVFWFSAAALGWVVLRATRFVQRAAP